jgi:hypothetical protein
LPIPFHDAEDIEELGATAFLHVESLASDNEQRFGALLFINARGEPLEFVYNRIELMRNILWRPSDREQAAVRRLAMTLFQAATLVPSILFCRADVVGPHLFGPSGQVRLDLPVGRIATASEAVGYAASESKETISTADSGGVICEAHIFWTPGPPVQSAADLYARLSERGLLLEPFERGGRGLREVYGESLGGET